MGAASLFQDYHSVPYMPVQEMNLEIRPRLPTPCYTPQWGSPVELLCSKIIPHTSVDLLQGGGGGRVLPLISHYHADANSMLRLMMDLQQTRFQVRATVTSMNLYQLMGLVC